MKWLEGNKLREQFGSIQDDKVSANFDLEDKEVMEWLKRNKFGKEQFGSIQDYNVLANFDLEAALKDVIESAKGNTLGKKEYRRILNDALSAISSQDAVKYAIESLKGNTLGKVDYRSFPNSDVWENPEQEAVKDAIESAKGNKLGETEESDMMEGGTAELNVGTYDDELIDSGTANEIEPDTKEELDTDTQEETDDVDEYENKQLVETFNDIEYDAKTNEKALLEKETPKSTNLMLDTGTEDKGKKDMLEISSSLMELCMHVLIYYFILVYAVNIRFDRE
ncbi:uncharacterized protein [Apostichopus japonicus]|uniref:uncharacterized protein isoform X3 n=1 Tax=Stichopus japonicus TaxID=307972 RepID=UPI003AB5DA66